MQQFLLDVTDLSLLQKQKSKYLENKTLIFLQIKLIHYEVRTKRCGGL